MADSRTESNPEAVPVAERSLVDIARDAFAAAMQVAEASLALLRAELQLARRSAVMIVWLGFALIFLGAAAWLSFTAAIVVGIFQLSGNLFLGIASVAAMNIAGAFWVVTAISRCWRDLSLPQTRALLVSAPDSSPELRSKA